MSAAAALKRGLTKRGRGGGYINITAAGDVSAPAEEDDDNDDDVDDHRDSYRRRRDRNDYEYEW